MVTEAATMLAMVVIAETEIAGNSATELVTVRMAASVEMKAAMMAVTRPKRGDLAGRLYSFAKSCPFA